jgi:Cys-rich repeat protein
VQCLSNADCASHTGKLCGPDGTCAVCLANTDCPMATPICHGDQCVQCFRDRDCADAGQTCQNGVCH